MTWEELQEYIKQEHIEQVFNTQNTISNEQFINLFKEVLDKEKITVFRVNVP